MASPARFFLKSDGKKMGKTENGALAGPERHRLMNFTSIEKWRTRTWERCLSPLTFLPMDEVHRFGKPLAIRRSTRF